MLRALTPILFDLDGTLLDSLDGIVASAQATLVHFGKLAIAREEVLAHIGAGAPFLIHGIFAVAGPGGQRPRIDEAHALAVYRAHYESHAEGSAKLFAGVPQLLDALGDRPLGVVSNKGERSVKAMLSATGIAGKFRLVAGYETFAEAKPSAVPLLAALERMGVGRDGAWMVGDGEQDLQAAKNAGLRCIAVSWGITPRHVLQALHPDYVVDTMQQLQERLS